MKQCQSCKHYQEPKGDLFERSWCSNPKSPNVNTYVYKGDECGEHVTKGNKRKAKDDTERI